MDILWILIIIFSLLLVFLIAVLIRHPSFSEQYEHIPSLKSSEGISDACSYDHSVLYEELTRKYPDLDLFMDTDAMKQGIFMHWSGPKKTDTKILFDITEHHMDVLLSSVQRLHWHQASAAFDFYILIRKDSKARTETKAYFSQYLLSRHIDIDAVINEYGTMAENEEKVYALLSERRFAYIDFALSADTGIAREIIERFHNKMPYRPDDETYYRVQQLKDDVPFSIRLGLRLFGMQKKAAEKLAEILPFAEVWCRPCTELIENEKPVIRLYARNDSELEEGITVLSSILQEAGLDYGITSQKRYALTMETGCTVYDMIQKAVEAVYPSAVSVHYGSCEMEGWPGIDTVGFHPGGDTAKQKKFYTALITDEEKHME